MRRVFAAWLVGSLAASWLTAQVQPPVLPDGGAGHASVANGQGVVLPEDFGRLTPEPGIADGTGAAGKRGGGSKAALASGVNQAPVVSELRLSNVSGSSVMLTLMANDANGSADLETVLLLVWDVVSARNSCFVQYRASDGVFQLANDNADAFVTTGVRAGSPQVQRNGQCALDVSQLDYLMPEARSTSLVLQMRLPFTESFAGTKRIYTFVQDRSGATSGWVDQAGFQVTGGASPQVGGAGYVAFGSDTNQPAVNLLVPVQATGGTQSLTTMYVIVNSTLRSAASCLLEFDLAGLRARVANDAGADWLAWVPMDATVQPLLPNPANQQCSLVRSAIRYSRAESSPQVAELRFQVQWLGDKGQPLRAFANVQDSRGRSSGWAEVGSAQSFPLPFRGTLTEPQIVAATTLSSATSDYSWAGIGSREALPVLAYHLIGALDSPTLSCLAEYNTATRSYRLATMDRTAWLPSAARLGSDEILDNGSCTLVAKRGFSALTAAQGFPGVQRLEVWFPVTVRGTLAQQLEKLYLVGNGENVHQMVVDERGLRSAWTSRSSGFRLQAKSPGDADTVQLGQITTVGGAYQFRVDVAEAANPGRPVRAILQVQDSLGLANGCQIEFRFAAPETQVRLMNDAGTAYSNAYLGQAGVTELANNQCTVSGAITSLSLTGHVAFFVLVQLKPGYRAPAAVRAMMDSALSAAKWVTRELTVVPLGGMEVLSMYPAEAMGLAAPMQLRVLHRRGVQYLHRIRVQIGSRVDDGANCRLEIVASSRQATATSGGANGFACEVGQLLRGYRDLVEGPWRDSLFAMPLEVPANPFSGLRAAVFVEATDIAGNSTGWKEVAVLWPATGGVRVVGEPLRQTITSPELPRTGELLLRLQTSHQQGATRLRNLYVLVHSELSSQGGCLLWLSLPQRQLRVAQADRSAWLPQVVQMGLPVEDGSLPYAGSLAAGRVSNGECLTLPGLSTQSQWNDNVLAVQLHVGLLAGMAGRKSIYVNVEASGGEFSGWLKMWELDVANSGAPVVQGNGSAEPVQERLGSQGREVRFLSRFRDGNGAFDFSRVSFAIGNSPNEAGACRWELDVVQERTAIYNDAGVLGPWQMANLPGNGASPPALRNSRCEVAAPPSSGYFFDTRVLGSQEPILETTQWVRLNGLADGPYSVYARATDLAGNTTDWQVVANHDNRSNPPKIVYSRPGRNVPLPVKVGGAAPKLDFSVEAANGIERLQTVYFIVRDGATTARACFVGFEPKTGILRLANDAGNDWLPTVLAQDGAGELRNGQCSVRLRAAFAGGGFIAPFVPIVAFTREFTGTKTYEIYAETDQATNTGWHIYDVLEIQP